MLQACFGKEGLRMKKVGICTVYTGYNYGSALQAVATKAYLRKIGYAGEILKLSGSIVSGRDMRPKKMLFMGMNMLCHFLTAKKTMQSLMDAERKSLPFASREAFDAYYADCIGATILSEKELKKAAKDNTYVAFICGSDQIWNATTYYVDPFYYLRFAPMQKRIAFAPSFGRDFIPAYNQKKLKRNIQAIPYLSIREESGKHLIQNLTGQHAEVLVDPTLLLNQQEWVDLLQLQPINRQPYVLAYFLDKPSEKARKVLKQFSAQGYQIISLPYEWSEDWFDVCGHAGPKEFLEYLWGADAVCTDSFHGVAFSLNFEKNFYAFDREYGGAAKQSTRVISLLEKVGLLNRFDVADYSCTKGIDYTACRERLNAERKKTRTYLHQALRSIEVGEK